MGKTVSNIQVLYEKMGTAEKRIANFILTNQQDILSLSITELSKKCNCGEATITRFAKRLNLRGYQQLKISIAKEENYTKVYENISGSDSPYTIFNKVCEDIYSSLEKTKAKLDKVQLNEFCSALLKVKFIYIFGLGNSASIAVDASHKLSRLGLHATACNDNHMQAIIASHTDKDCLVLGISHSGSSKDIIEAMKIAKDRGAITATITDRSKSPIYRISDYILTTESNETNYRILGLNSRIAQLAIIDTVYSYLVCHLPTSKQSIHDTEKALLDKKI
jgi:DNA-binding MurR/RpiR family transcriptional regulator